MRVHRARWVLPIAGPVIEHGWVAVAAGRVTAVGTGPAPGDATPADPWDGASCAILPGLVNAHTHLELSWMAGQVPPGDAMPDWASRLIALRVTASPAPEVRDAAIRRAIAASRAAGTALVGDIGNAGDAVAPLLDSPLAARVFRELIGFRVTEPAAVIEQALLAGAALTGSGRVRFALAPHAPYSVSPELLRAIGVQGGDGPVSIHLGESADEVRFLRAGGGAWQTVLERVGAWRPDWRPPGVSPVRYLDGVGLLNRRLVAVHGVQLDDADLAALAAAGATLVTCPRSNLWTGAGAPPLARFYAAGVSVAVGTDSLASVDSLSVFDELAAMRRLAPEVPAAALLASATTAGAAALGFGRDLGIIETGRPAALLAVRVPDGTRDVEEYLVTGVPPRDLRWIEAA